MYTVAVIGATGAVGQEIIRLLEERKFPVKNIRCFASPTSAGKPLSFAEKTIEIGSLTENSFKGVDIALFSAGKTVSKTFAPIAISSGTIVIDNSSAFRMDTNTPLVIPEINGHTISSHQGLLSSPNCVVTIMLMTLFLLHRFFKMKRVVATTYQAASGAGRVAMHELKEESLSFLNGKPFHRTIMPYPYAFNLFPHNAPMTSSGYNEEEIKVIEESRKILEEPHLPIAVTCVRVPVLRAHSIALNVAFENPITKEKAREILINTPGVALLEDWENNRFPMPSDASGKDDIFVGRIRKDLSQPNTLDLWVVGDQLLKGAALNTVQIAEMFIRPLA